MENSLKDLENSCSILISSCDAYQDLWQPFFTQFLKHWENCPFKIYLCANVNTFQNPKVYTLHAGQEKNWSNAMLIYLSHISSKYILLCLEDFFMRRDIKTSEVLSCLAFMESSDAHYLRLIPRQKPDKRYQSPVLKDLGEYSTQCEYRVSMQASLWKKESLLKLIRAHESIWEFEIYGSLRSRDLFPKGFYGVFHPIFTYDHHVIERGKWFRKEAAYFGSLNIGCDFNRREIMSRKETYIWKLKKIFSVFLSFLPFAFQKFVRKKLSFMKKFI